MAFAKGDPNINRSGRTRTLDDGKKSKRQIKDQELIQLARKVKPHLAAGILAASKIISDKEATDQNVLKAAAFMAELYRKLIIDIYDADEVQDEDAIEIQAQNKAPKFSLHMLKSDMEDTKED